MPQGFDQHRIALVERIRRGEFPRIVTEATLAWDENQAGGNAFLDRQRVMPGDGLQCQCFQSEIAGDTTNKIDADGIERVGYATSSDGLSWTKRGVVVNPGLAAYSSDESGVEPTGIP